MCYIMGLYFNKKSNKFPDQDLPEMSAFCLLYDLMKFI